jgi:hypothetical protein
MSIPARSITPVIVLDATDDACPDNTPDKPERRVLDRRVHGVRDGPEIAWRPARRQRSIRRGEHVPVPLDEADVLRTGGRHRALDAGHGRETRRRPGSTAKRADG